MNLYKRSSAKLTRKSNNATTLCRAILKRDGKARSLHLCLSLVVHIRRNHRHQHVFYAIDFYLWKVWMKSCQTCGDLRDSTLIINKPSQQLIYKMKLTLDTKINSSAVYNDFQWLPKCQRSHAPCCFQWLVFVLFSLEFLFFSCPSCLCGSALKMLRTCWGCRPP